MRKSTVMKDVGGDIMGMEGRTMKKYRFSSEAKTLRRNRRSFIQRFPKGILDFFRQCK
jgi:hypothetical protein